MKTENFGLGRFASVMTDQTSEVFSVRAAKNAIVALTEVTGVVTYNTLELLIGGENNDRVELKDGIGGELLLTEMTTQPLNVDEFR